MAQFLDGLQDRITRKVERQNYEHFHDLIHFAIQAEQHIKRKTAATSRSKSTWTPPAQRNDKGKSIEIESRFKKNSTADASKGNKAIKASLVHLETETSLATSAKVKDIMQEIVLIKES